MIQVTPKKDAAPGDPVLDEAAVKRIAALPGVAMASPDFRVRGIKLSRGEKSQNVIGLGLPSEVPLLGVTQDVIVAGSYFHPGEVYQVILSRRLAADMGFALPEDAVGQTLTLEASGLTPEQSATFAYEHKTLTVTVVGVYDIPELMFGPMSTAVAIPLELIREIPGVQLDRALETLRAGPGAADAGYRRITVRVVGHNDLYPVTSAIREMGYEARTLLDQLDQMRSFFVFIERPALRGGDDRPGGLRAGHLEHAADVRAGAAAGDRHLQGDRGVGRRPRRALSHRSRDHRPRGRAGRPDPRPLRLLAPRPRHQRLRPAPRRHHASRHLLLPTLAPRRDGALLDPHQHSRRPLPRPPRRADRPDTVVAKGVGGW